MRKIFSKEIDVYYEDTDSSGFVYHSSYLKFAERARSDLVKSKFPEIIDLMKKNSFFFVLKQVNIDFLLPCYLYDKLRVDTFLTSCKLVSLDMRHSIFRDKKLVCEIDAKLVWLNGRKKKPSRVPDNIIARFKSLEVV